MKYFEDTECTSSWYRHRILYWKRLLKTDESRSRGNVMHTYSCVNMRRILKYMYYALLFFYNRVILYSRRVNSYFSNGRRQLHIWNCHSWYQLCQSRQSRYSHSKYREYVDARETKTTSTLWNVQGSVSDIPFRISME